MEPKSDLPENKQWVIDFFTQKLDKKYRTRIGQAWEIGFLLKNDREYIIGHAYYEVCALSLRPVIIVNQHKSELSHLRIDMYPTAMLGKQIPESLLARISAVPGFKRTEDFNISPGFVNIVGQSSEIERIAQVAAAELIKKEIQEG